jgi:predicted phosphodiesterase
MPDFRPRLKGQRKKAFDSITKEESRVLVIGDIHEPFCKSGYLEFCIKTYQEKNCSRVVFIGDIVDNHYSSYHETDPDGMSGGMELSLAISKIEKWSKAFPKADVIVGNHDRMIMRKAFSSSIPKEWIKSYNDVLGTDWVWHNRLEIDGVQYVHGEGGTAKTRAKNDGISTVQGTHPYSGICGVLYWNSWLIFWLSGRLWRRLRILCNGICKSIQKASDFMCCGHWWSHCLPNFNAKIATFRRCLYVDLSDFPPFAD